MARINKTMKIHGTLSPVPRTHEGAVATRLTNPAPQSKFGYMINVASYQNGVGSANKWDKIDGFSEAVVDYIINLETEGLNNYGG